LKKDALLNQIVTLAGDDRHLFVAPAITARPKKPTPISLSDLTQEVDKAREAINAAEEHFQKWRHDDEHKDEKQSLKLYLAEYEPKVKEARERLNQLEAEPPAFIKFSTKVGLLERNVSGLAAEVQLNLASEAAEHTLRLNRHPHLFATLPSSRQYTSEGCAPASRPFWPKSVY
jgi:hypothetical protein